MIKIAEAPQQRRKAVPENKRKYNGKREDNF